MGSLEAKYVTDDTTRCEVCHKCFLKCGRYADSNRYRFKACAGTASECSRQSTKADKDGEVTFAGKPFESEITSLRFGSYSWSGARQRSSQYVNQMQSRRRLSNSGNDFSLRLTGLSFDRFVESADAKQAAALKIAESLGIDVKRLKINGVRKGSVIIDFEITDSDDDDNDQVQYDRFYNDHRSGALKVSLQRAISSVKGLQSEHLDVAELKKPHAMRGRLLSSLEDVRPEWQCYVDRYADVQVDTEILAKEHWDRVGEAEGRLWGCFHGYFDSPTDPKYFVLTTTGDGWNKRAMRPNIKLFLGASDAASGGFLHLTTFEQSSHTLKKRVVEMPLTYSIVAGNENKIFAIDKKTGQIRIETPNLLNRAKKDLYQLQVASTDLGGLSTVTTVDITILESNDPPTIYPIAYEVTEIKGGTAFGRPCMQTIV